MILSELSPIAQHTNFSCPEVQEKTCLAKAQYMQLAPCRDIPAKFASNYIFIHILIDFASKGHFPGVLSWVVLIGMT